MVPSGNKVGEAETICPDEGLHLHFLIDGCNGPIRFSEQDLASKTKEVRDAAISILNCHNFKEKTRRDSKSNRGSTRKKGHGTSSVAWDAAASSAFKLYERLDILPLAECILQSTDSPFETMTIIFDGVSQTKRPTPTQQLSKSGTENAQPRNPHESLGKNFQLSEHIQIQITGLYDETDNVIVERVKNWQQCMKRDLRNGAPSTKDEDLDGTLSNLFAKSLVTAAPTQEQLTNEGNPLDQCSGTPELLSLQVTVIRRSDQGPGKARSILQPLGLLRPDSPLCLFKAGFGSQALQKDAENTLFQLLRHKIGRDSLRPFKELELSTDFIEKVPFVPVVVVTDDIFLRQRVVSCHGFVMSFHQFWILLAEMKYLHDVKKS
jgi:hypothetical protein